MATALGLIAIVTRGSVTVEVADLDGTALLIALMVTSVPSMSVGAVYRPVLSIRPTLGATLQVTLLSLGPVTCAMNCCDSPRRRFAVGGVTAIVVGGGVVIVDGGDDDPQAVIATTAAHNVPVATILITSARIFAPPVERRFTGGSSFWQCRGLQFLFNSSSTDKSLGRHGLGRHGRAGLTRSPPPVSLTATGVCGARSRFH